MFSTSTSTVKVIASRVYYKYSGVVIDGVASPQDTIRVPWKISACIWAVLARNGLGGHFNGCALLLEFADIADSLTLSY